MSTPPTRPRGRRPGNDDTRGTIRDAALELFSQSGYDKVSVRAIARAAGVDPALVHHYYPSKAALFTETVLDFPVDVDAHVRAIVEGDPAGIGVRAARQFFGLWDSPDGRAHYLALLRGVFTDGRRRRSLNEFMAREVFARVATHVGHSDAVLRGQLAVSATLGVMVGRHVLQLPVLSSTSMRALVVPVGHALQYYLVEPW